MYKSTKSAAAARVRERPLMSCIIITRISILPSCNSPPPQVIYKSLLPANFPSALAFKQLGLPVFHSFIITGRDEKSGRGLENCYVPCCPCPSSQIFQQLTSDTSFPTPWEPARLIHTLPCWQDSQTLSTRLSQLAHSILLRSSSS